MKLNSYTFSVVLNFAPTVYAFSWSAYPINLAHTHIHTLIPTLEQKNKITSKLKQTQRDSENIENESTPSEQLI